MEVHCSMRLFSSGTAWGRRADLFLLFLALLGIGLHALAEATRKMSPQPHLQQKMAAATRTVRCFEAIRLARMGTPAAMDEENDPSASGLIGQEFTLTTTDRGVLEAKLTSINPNFAAVFIEYFYEAGLKPGDPVAIALTGSFPALNIAVLTAAEEMELRAIPITSVGASMWGANDPYFSWLDMERLLNDKGLLRTRSVAASLGGSNDRGRGLSPRGRGLLEQAIERNEIRYIDKPTLDESIKERVEIFNAHAEPERIKAYVNLGGGAASTGTSQNVKVLRAGVNERIRPYNFTLRGALHHYGLRGVPVIHILRIQTIAERHGLPVSPESVPPVGEGEIFYQESYDLRITVPALLSYLVLCFGVLRARQRAARTAREAMTPPVVVSDMDRNAVGEGRGG
ncbi:MAG: poly-gamma-glutamate system protein [Candidatus Eisenbacteria bacterium]|nr:poly-gamma-glutamate system protein [Candidatus Latescibacterota bacterium]MBD3302874.1 poly-gamma-glutamate system protein [Candidatus Eisenbacteria bacterium]